MKKRRAIWDFIKEMDRGVECLARLTKKRFLKKIKNLKDKKVELAVAAGEYPYTYFETYQGIVDEINTGSLSLKNTRFATDGSFQSSIKKRFDFKTLRMITIIQDNEVKK